MNLQTNKSIIAIAISLLLSVYPAGASAQVRVTTDAPEPVSGRSVHDPVAALRSAKLIYVRSSSVLVGASVVEEKLQKRAEFSQMGLVITRDVEEADLILELHHDRFTKYVYTALDARTSMVVASGKLSSLGGTVAGKVAKRFLEQVRQARAATPKS